MGTNRGLECDINPDIRLHAGRLAGEDWAAIESETTQISIALQRSWVTPMPTGLIAAGMMRTAGLVAG